MRTELSIEEIVTSVDNFRSEWKEHVERMPEYTLPLQVLGYQPQGKRKVGRPKKRQN